MNQKQPHSRVQCLCAVSLFLLPRAGDSRPSYKAARASRQAAVAAKQAIRYVGGRSPYVLVIPGKVIPYAYQDKSNFHHVAYTQLSRQTPSGPVSIYWREDSFLEGGVSLAHPDEEFENADVMQVAIITPPNLPIVLEVEQPDYGWLHVNGHVISYFAGKSQSVRAYVRRIRLEGGLNLIEAGVHDAE